MNTIKLYREKLGMSQEQLAGMMGVRQSTVAMWETQKNFPRSDKLPLLAAVLSCTVDELFAADPAPKRVHKKKEKRS